MKHRRFKITDRRKGCSFYMWGDAERFVRLRLWLSAKAGGLGIPRSELRFYVITEVRVQIEVCAG